MVAVKCFFASARVGHTRGRRYPRPAHGDARSEFRPRSPPTPSGGGSASRTGRGGGVGGGSAGDDPVDSDLDEFVTPDAAPTVVAVLVTSDPGPWLEDALASLAAQDYPRAVGARARQRLDRGPDAPDRGGDARSLRPPARTEPGSRPRANEALPAVEGATFLLFCHDDVAPDPDAVRRAWSRRRTGRTPAIVGPKLVDYDQPDDPARGRAWPSTTTACRSRASSPARSTRSSTTRCATSSSCRNAAMLVRADLFHELGGFDPRRSPGADDIDLCWRARLAGARVLVAPDARARPPARDRRRRGSRRHDPPSDVRAAETPHPVSLVQVVLRGSRSYGCCQSPSC